MCSGLGSDSHNELFAAGAPFRTQDFDKNVSDEGPTFHVAWRLKQFYFGKLNNILIMWGQ